ncbi:MAG: MarR family transcriptional regulator [Alysiella sp.]|uniref:MarR family winged helix-turn-helix transcriptional regulator n=1 Tax=Alysiella sp. TaxID=1872483 RepID=UPI0026DD9F86|nr:MarR family transcriptional regulator [Alysiella sp.]MDO4433260.1 MarR family transcriptional regulator [Alysiella sp.]
MNTSLEQYAESAPTVSYNLGRLDRLVHQQLGDALGKVGISVPQFTMLSNLYQRGATANATLAARSFISPQAANQIVKVMEQQGWVQKHNDPNHGRLVLIELTDEGRELYRRCAEQAAAFEQKMLDGLPPETVIMLKATLKRLLDNLRR